MKCPSCGTESEGGTYCAECGAPLAGAPCPHCGASLVPGARFCTHCGEAVRTSASNLPWYIAGVAVVALIVTLLLPVLRGGPGNAGTGSFADVGPNSGAAPATGSSAGVGGAPGPLTGTPREQADRLFNRIMTALDNNDRQQAEFFLPMGIQAYQMAGDLDADGLYHLSLLQSAAGKPEDALSTAKQILATSPDHLLGLGSAAQAALAAGDSAAAVDYWQHFLRVYDAESKKGLQEYVDHANVLPTYRQQAQDELKLLTAGASGRR